MKGIVGNGGGKGTAGGGTEGEAAEQEARKLMERCPRFKGCSVAGCPLDLDQAKRVVLDGEPRCTLPKAKRRLLGNGTALPHGGLTAREEAAEQAWARLTPEEQAARRARARGFLRGR